MSATDRWNWIVSLALTLVTAGWFYIGFLPERREIVEIRRQTDSIEQQVLAATGLPAAVASAQTELDKTRAYNRAWRERSPTQRGLSVLYERIHEMAKQNGVTTTKFEPQPVQAMGALRRTPLVLGGSGAYAKVHELLAQLEEMDMPLWVDTLQISQKAESEGDVTSEMGLVIFSDN